MASFKKEFLQAIVGDEVDGLIEETITDTSRWSVNYDAIFEHEGQFYRTSYSRGATEQQDESPFEFDEDEIECEEVEQVEKLVKVWETKQ